MESKKKAQELLIKHGFYISNLIIDAIIDENFTESNQSKIDFWLDVKNDLKRAYVNFTHKTNKDNITN